MNLTQKLSAVLSIKDSLLRSAGLPEHIRGYSIQSRIEESDKLLMQLLNEIIKEEVNKVAVRTEDDDIPF
jgi:hypothetical protein